MGIDAKPYRPNRRQTPRIEEEEARLLFVQGKREAQPKIPRCVARLLRLADIIAKLGLRKSSVLQHMTSVIQPLLEKGIVVYYIIHTALMEVEMKASVSDNDNGEICRKNRQLAVGGKKDPSVYRCELPVESGLAESLIATCIDNVGELLRSNFGKEVPVGQTDGVLQPLADRLDALHETIASLAALPKTSKAEEEHVFENFHSGRTIRKLVLDGSTFAVITLWKTALEGKSEMWAQGLSCKVVTAFLGVIGFQGQSSGAIGTAAVDKSQISYSP